MCIFSIAKMSLDLSLGLFDPGTFISCNSAYLYIVGTVIYSAGWLADRWLIFLAGRRAADPGPAAQA